MLEPVAWKRARPVLRGPGRFARSSGELRVLRREPKDVQGLWGEFDPWVRGQLGGRVARRGCASSLSCGVAVSDGGGLVEAEHGGEVERVGAVGEGLVELPVDAQGFQGGGSAAEWRGERVLADGPGGRGGLLVDDQVRVGGVAASGCVGRRASRSASRWVSSSSGRVTRAMVSRRLPRSTSSRRRVRMASGRAACTAARARASRAAGVVAAWVGVVDLVGAQGEDDRFVAVSDPDSRGRVGEDGAGLLAVPHQRAQRAEGSPARVAAQGVGDRGDVAGGDLAQVVVAGGPFDQHRVGAAQVAADGVRCRGGGYAARRGADACAQPRTSAAMPGARSASLSSSQVSKAGTRSSSSNPISASTSATRVMLTP